MKTEKKMALFANCIPVKGANRSIICDLGRDTYSFIPNDLYDVLTLHEGKTIHEIKTIYNHEFDDVLEEYFAYLLEEEYIFFTHNPQYYPKLNLDFHQAFTISNAIIDIDKEVHIIDYLKKLETIKCKFLEIRFFNSFSEKTVLNVLDYLKTNKSVISSVGFIIQHNEKITIDYLQDIIRLNPIVSYFIISGSTENKFVNSINEKMGYLYFTQTKITDESHCGIIAASNFVVNTKNFTESIVHNSCLANKLAIDKNGHIKNCPAMKDSFGSITSVSIEEVITKKNFKKYWNINKDQIDTCKDCEFRYICTDCRAFLEEPNNDFSKPLKCGYNPYTNEWQDWSTDPFKKKAIAFYGF